MEIWIKCEICQGEWDPNSWKACPECVCQHCSKNRMTIGSFCEPCLDQICQIEDKESIGYSPFPKTFGFQNLNQDSNTVKDNSKLPQRPRMSTGKHYSFWKGKVK